MNKNIESFHDKDLCRHKEQLTFEYCFNAVKTNKKFLRHVPEKYKTEEL